MEYKTIINCFIVNQRFLWLLIILLLYIASSTIQHSFIMLRFIIAIIYYFVFISIVYSMSKKKLYRLILALFAIFNFLFNFMINSISSPISNSLISFSHFGMMIFNGIIIVTFLSYIFKVRLVTRDIVIGAFVVYLLIGIVWSDIFAILELFSPGTFLLSELQTLSYRHFLYYSFESLNLGKYGLIIPLSGTASFFSMLQALIAQIYMMVQVAWLVNIFFSQSMSKRSL